MNKKELPAGTRNFKQTMTILGIAAFFAFSQLYAETSGFAMLDMPTSAMSASTMSVFTAEPENAMNLFENPVGICCDVTNISFTNNFWFADVNQSVLTLGKNTKWGTFGAGLNFINAPGIEVRSRPSDEPEGKIEAQYLATDLGFSRELIPNILMGVNGKFLYESLYTESATGFAFDVAALWKMPSNMNFSVGLHNLGSMNPLKEKATQLPSSLKIGLVRPRLLGDEGSFNGALGINFDHNLVADETAIKVGGELSVYEKFFLRGGYSIQKEFNDISIGAGFNSHKFRFDFAMMLMDGIPDYPLIFTFSSIL
ncbi:MAG: PorV/PorQ family protein [Candidatus Marinimicrobia bacterium]|nr:PorV/PorQ family protein [Candidatus Neomarinimicrobiota bacterium]